MTNNEEPRAHPMLKLFEIRREMQAIVMPEHGEIDESQLQELDTLADRFEAKVGNCVAALKNLRASEEQIGKTIKELQQHQRAIKNSAGKLSDYVHSEMKAAGIDKVSDGIHSARIARSQPSVEVIDESIVDDEWIKVERKVMSRAIIENFKETGEIPEGVQVLTDNTHLRIS